MEYSSGDWPAVLRPPVDAQASPRLDRPRKSAPTLPHRRLFAASLPYDSLRRLGRSGEAGLVRWNRARLPQLAKRAGGADAAWPRPALSERRNARRRDRAFADRGGAASAARAAPARGV